MIVINVITKYKTQREVFCAIYVFYTQDNRVHSVGSIFAALLNSVGFISAGSIFVGSISVRSTSVDFISVGSIFVGSISIESISVSFIYVSSILLGSISVYKEKLQ